MIAGFTELEKKIFSFVKDSSNPIFSALCSFIGCKEGKGCVECPVRAKISELCDKGYLRVDEGSDGREDRVKPHPDRPNLLWQLDLS
jgi:hypothetical protein